MELFVSTDKESECEVVITGASGCSKDGALSAGLLSGIVALAASATRVNKMLWRK